MPQQWFIDHDASLKVMQRYNSFSVRRVIRRRHACDFWWRDNCTGNAEESPLKASLAVGAVCAAMAACGSPAPSPSPPSGPPRPTFALSGRVIDATTSRPITAALVEILDGDGNALLSATSDATGAFRFAALSQGVSYTIRISHSGYDSASGLVFLDFADESADFRLTPAMTTPTGTWTGVFAFSTTTGSPQSATIVQTDLRQLDASFYLFFGLTDPPYTVDVNFTVQDPSAIGSTTGITGTLAFGYRPPRFPQYCHGTTTFTGTINWTTMSVTAPQVTMECGITYTNVVLSLVKQQGFFAP
jgi:hypothetical protein